MSIDSSARKRLFLWRAKASFHSGYERTSPVPQTLPVKDPICQHTDAAAVRAHKSIMARNEILSKNPAGSFSYTSGSGKESKGSIHKMWTSRPGYGSNESYRSPARPRSTQKKEVPSHSPSITVTDEQIKGMSDSELASFVRRQAVEVATLAGIDPPKDEDNSSKGSSSTLSTSPSSTHAPPQLNTIRRQPQESTRPAIQQSLGSSNMVTSKSRLSESTTVANLRQMLSMSISREKILREKLIQAGMFNQELLLDSAAATDSHILPYNANGTTCEQQPLPPSHEEIPLVPEEYIHRNGINTWASVPNDVENLYRAVPPDYMNVCSQGQDHNESWIKMPRFNAFVNPYEFYLQRRRCYQNIREKQLQEQKIRDRAELQRDVHAEYEYLSLVHEINSLIAEARSRQISVLTSPSRRLDQQALRAASIQKEGKSRFSHPLVLSSPSTSRLRKMPVRAKLIRAPFFRMSEDGDLTVEEK